MKVGDKIIILDDGLCGAMVFKGEIRKVVVIRTDGIHIDRKGAEHMADKIYWWLSKDFEDHEQGYRLCTPFEADVYEAMQEKEEDTDEAVPVAISVPVSAPSFSTTIRLALPAEEKPKKPSPKPEDLLFELVKKAFAPSGGTSSDFSNK